MDHIRQSSSFGSASNTKSVWFEGLGYLLIISQILPFCLIPHSTHLCQALDVVIFSQMQQEYRKIVFEYQKKNVNINKTEFSHMLKQVCDKVLQSSNIVWAFEACSMFPFDFAASYAYKQVPLPKQPKPEPEDAWMDEEEVVTSVGIESRNEALLSMVSTSATNSNLQCSSRSSSHSTSQDNSHSSTPNSHRHHIHAGRMDDIDTPLAALTLDVTPRCVAAPCREVLDVTCQDAAQDQSTSAYIYKNFNPPWIKELWAHIGHDNLMTADIEKGK